MRCVIALLLLAAPALAETSEGAAARLIEAHRLAALGQEARDPVLVLAAARLMQGLQLTMTRLEPADPTDSAATPPPGPADLALGAAARVPDPTQAAPLPGALDVALLFETARQMAPPESALREAIALAASEIPAPPALLRLSRQSATGPQSHRLDLPGGDPVQIGVLRLSGDLSWQLSTEDGTILCQDGSTSAGSLCTVTLAEAQALTLSTTGSGDWLLARP